MAVGFMGTDFQAKPSILDPLRTKFDVFGRDRNFGQPGLDLGFLLLRLAIPILSAAIQHSSLPLVRLLLKHGAQVQSRGEESHGAARPDFFTFFWLRGRSETLRSGSGMLLDQVSGQTVHSGPDLGIFDDFTFQVILDFRIFPKKRPKYLGQFSFFFFRYFRFPFFWGYFLVSYIFRTMRIRDPFAREAREGPWPNISAPGPKAPEAC